LEEVFEDFFKDPRTLKEFQLVIDDKGKHVNVNLLEEIFKPAIFPFRLC
jgi:hypothetical protein